MTDADLALLRSIAVGGGRITYQNPNRTPSQTNATYSAMVMRMREPMLRLCRLGFAKLVDGGVGWPTSTYEITPLGYDCLRDGK